MQMLWSRTAQARSSCRCNICLHAATTLARRTTTAVTRRRVGLGDVVTALYSTILASAALADSRRKEDRSKAWDRAIAEAKEGKPLHEIQTPGLGFKDDSTSPRSQSSSTESYDSTSVPCATQSKYGYERIPSATQYAQALHEFQLEQKAGGVFEKKGYLDICDPLCPPVEPRGWKDLKNLEQATATLVQNLLRKLSFNTHADGGRSTITDDGDTRREIHAVMSRFQTFSESPTKFPSYIYEDYETVQMQRSELLTSLESIFSNVDSTRPGKIDLMILKLCYNLLLSQSPPTTRTFDLILTEMSRLERTDMVQDVVDAFWGSRLRPSKVTSTLIVKHYTSVRDQAGLRMMRRKLLGVDDKVGDGSKAWSNRSERLVRYPNNTLSGTPKDSLIHDSLIIGHLEMQGHRPAMRLIRHALHSDLAIAASTLSATIECTLADKDHSAAISLLLAIMIPWLSGYYHIRISFDGHLRLMMLKLLRFVGVDPQRGSKGYLITPLSGERTSRQYGRDLEPPRKALDGMLLHMRIEAMTSCVDRISESVNVLSSLIQTGKGMPVSGLAPDHVFSRTIYCLDHENQVFSSLMKRDILNNGGLPQTYLTLQGREESLAVRERSVEIIGLEVKLIEAITMSARGIELLRDRLQTLEDMNVDERRIQYLQLLLELLQHQMAGVSLQIQWMETIHEHPFEDEQLHRAWDRQYLTEIEDKLRSVTAAYTQYHANSPLREIAPFQMEYLPSRPWTYQFTSGIRYKVIDPYRKELPARSLARVQETEQVIAPMTASPVTKYNYEHVGVAGIETAFGFGNIGALA